MCKAFNICRCSIHPASKSFAWITLPDSLSNISSCSLLNCPCWDDLSVSKPNGYISVSVPHLLSAASDPTSPPPPGNSSGTPALTWLSSPLSFIGPGLGPGASFLPNPHPSQVALSLGVQTPSTPKTTAHSPDSSLGPPLSS